MIRLLFVLAMGCTPIALISQVAVQEGAILYLDSASQLSIQSYLESDEDIEGKGSIVLNGQSLQTISMNDHIVPQLVIENTQNVVLSSNMAIQKKLILQSGHLLCDHYTVSLGSESSVYGGQGAYIKTGNGKLTKDVVADFHNFFIPIGTENAFTPLLLNSEGIYHYATIEVSAKENASPNKPAASKDYINHYWSVKRTGMSGALTAVASYADITGSEPEIQPRYWNGAEWVNTSAYADTKNHRLMVEIPEGSGQIYGMSQEKGSFLNGKSFTVFPNPTRAQATVFIESETDQEAAVRVNDSRGNIVITKKLRLVKGVNQEKINMAPMASGYYTITAVTDSGSRTTSLIKN